MPTFRFRAQAALDLRRREHEQSLRELAHAETEQQRARALVEAAECALVEAKRTADSAMRTLTSASELHWYQIWIVRLDRERGGVMAALEARGRDVARAREACARTRQRQESLERFREKALATFHAAEDARERKMIDELATQRYARSE